MSHAALRIADTDAWNAASGRKSDVREGSPIYDPLHPPGTDVVREYCGTLSEPKACMEIGYGKAQ